MDSWRPINEVAREGIFVSMLLQKARIIARLHDRHPWTIAAHAGLLGAYAWEVVRRG